MSGSDTTIGPSCSITRRLAWAETDAAGHNHFSVALRWLEEAEHALWLALGRGDMVPVIPRVHLEINYRERVYFAQVVRVIIWVKRLGNSSCTFAWNVTSDAGALLMEGGHTVVYTPDGTGSQAWPDDVRAALHTPGQLHST